MAFRNISYKIKFNHSVDYVEYSCLDPIYQEHTGEYLTTFGAQDINMDHNKKITGVIAAVVTPLDIKGHPHLENLQVVIRQLILEGVNGILLLGTTGEGPSMSLTEQSEVISAALEVSEDIFTLSCTVNNSLPDAIYGTKNAVDAGVDGIVALPPYYYKNLQINGLVEYFSHLLNEALPENRKLYLYNIPQLTGVPISSQLLHILLEQYPNRIGGVKDSLGNFTNTIDLCQQFPQLDIFVGTDRFLLDGLKIGSAGCVTAGANILAPLDVAVYQSFLRGNLLAAEEIQQKLTAARMILEKYPPFPSTLKSLLRFRYKTEGWEVRPPLSDLSNDHLQPLLEELKQSGIEGYLPWLMK